MEKLWAGRFTKELDKIAFGFNSSIDIDSRMYRQDIQGSMAHTSMLVKQGIIEESDGILIVDGLSSILEDIDSGKLEITSEAEDIHSFVETELTARIGDAGKRLHTARSRNDQVALDVRLYLRDEAAEVLELIKKLIGAICLQAEKNTDTVMPGYTHLQRAQPITFAHHILAYAMMFIRDAGRIEDAVKRMNLSPLGSCALSGTTYNTDRTHTAKLLEFDGYTLNSIDGVSDRDFCVELQSALSLIMTHLSRLSEEIILWSSWEFKFVELDDSYTTGSSIMPQKKNPDMAELVRGKTGRVYGNLMQTLTMLKGLPLAYNKDMQEDKESIFDSFDTVKVCLQVTSPMIETMTVLKENTLAAANRGFINATDLADYLTKKGMPFREAYKITGQIVRFCIENNFVLDNMPLEEYKKFSDMFDSDLYDEINLFTCVKKRISQGGTGPDSVNAQIEYIKEYLK
ncbi:MAG: argininosuccinate lyase [Ruminococcaceae bacterium]|nr:argininosuccinate lyase [Oscillospiraceae bacterium]